MSTQRPLSFLGCLRLGPAAVGRSLRAPRILLLVAGTMVLIAALEALPVYQEVAKYLHHLPGAEGRYGRLLLEDLERNHPETRLLLGGSGLLAMFLWTFFAGGVLATVGLVSARRFGIADFLAASGRFFFRSLRCWFVFLVALLVWTWLSLDLAKPELESFLVDGGDENSLFLFDLGVNVVWFLGFASCWILRRLALARLVLLERRSALLAWLVSIGLLVRRPFRTVAGFTSLFVVWGLGLAACALALDLCLDAELFPLALVLGIVPLFWFQLCLAGSFVLARRLWVLQRSRRGEAPPAEPAVVMPRSEQKVGRDAVVEVARTVH